MTAALRIARNAALVGYLDVRGQYTWKTWLFGWIARATAQVLFFVAMGLVVGGSDFVQYAFIGNVVAMAALMPLGTGPDTAWERGLGTLPLLIAAPRSMLPVFAGRSAFYVVEGAGEASLIFVILAPFVGWSGQWWWLPLGLVVVSLGSYGLGVFLAAVSIRRVRIGNILFNLVFYTLVTICGVNVATTVFPEWVQTVAHVLPLYHGLLATRDLLANGASTGAFGQLGWELVVGVGWFVVAMLGFKLFAEGGRKDGTIGLEE